MSVIPADAHIALLAILLGLTWFGLYLETKPIGKLTTGLVWTGALAILLSNTGLIPKSAPVYDVVRQIIVPVAIPLFLLSVDLRRIFSETGRVLIAFILGAATTLIGAYLGSLTLDLGDTEAQLAGIFAATYIGGTVNFVSSAEVLQMEAGAFLSAALAADSLVGKTYLLLLALLSSIPAAVRWFGHSGASHGPTQDQNQNDPAHQPSALFDVAALTMIAAGVAATGYALAAALGVSSYGILFVTVLSFVPRLVARERVSALRGSFNLGLFLAFLFFAAIGATADFMVLVSVAPAVMVFAAIIVVIHAVLLFPLAKLMKLSLAETITASNACILGPTTAAALAASRGWTHLVTPGLLVGLFGYATGTFLGVILFKLIT